MSRYSRIIIAAALTIAVAALMWFASPTSAFDVTFPTLPSSGTIGSQYTFTTKINIDSSELLPIQSVHLYIYKSDNRASYNATALDLPLSATSKSYTNSQTGGGPISVTAQTANWTYGYGYGYASWQGYGYRFFPPGGYGYGYGYGTLNKSISYSVVWTPPSGWPSGQYQIEVSVLADTDTFTKSSSTFTLSQPSAPAGGDGGGGGGGGGGGAPGLTSVADVVTPEGRFTMDTTAKSGDRMLEFFIPKNTIGLNRSGSRLTSIKVEEMEGPPAAPSEAMIIGLVYDVGPFGATFTPSGIMSIKYYESLLPQGATERNLIIITFDDSTDQWVELESTCDVTNNVVTANVSHFTPFTILARTRPASFSITDISVTPGEVELGKSVDVKVLVNNTGDLTGTYNVDLKIGGEVAQTMPVTVAGGDSETVIFQVVPNAAGTLTISIGEETGSIQVFKPATEAQFITSNLIISPQEVTVAEEVTISVTVSNVGDLPGNYDLVLKVDDQIVETREITLAGKENRRVTFTMSRDVAGTYEVSVNGRSGLLRVNPESAPPEPTPTVPATTPAPPPSTPVTPTPGPGISWWMIAIVVAVGILGGIGITIVVRLRRY